jgi:hypothetical protein
VKNYQYLFSFFIGLFFIPLGQAAIPSVVPLSYRIVDAEYSKSLNRIISVSANPSRLHSYDPIKNVDTYVNLSLSPSSVSVSPDGLFAAIGHDARISYVDLQNGKLIKNIPVTTDVFDLVLPGNGFVYAFPMADQWVDIHSVNIKTGKETLGGSGFIREGTVAKLHPNGQYMYGANNGLSPSDIEKYGIGKDGSVSLLYDSPYHGDFDMCGNLWISEDGLRIFTACGNVFRSSTVKSDDMTYNGKLSNTNSVQFLSHSKKAKNVVVIPDVDTTIQTYNYNYLTLQNKKTLPKFTVGNANYAAHGRFVFHNSDSSKFFVIVQADQSSGMLNDFGVVSYNTGLAPCSASSANADCDSDGILNKNDNCILVPNKLRAGTTSQLDSDTDHYGNFCDADLNNDYLVNGKDFSLWLGDTPETSSWLSKCGGALYNETSDFNGDCKIDIADSNIIMKFLFKKPGPSCIDLPVSQRGGQC